eukprot:scaffold120324_cov42-Phaeocystis_antarctica.AAC.1
MVRGRGGPLPGACRRARRTRRTVRRARRTRHTRRTARRNTRCTCRTARRTHCTRRTRKLPRWRGYSPRTCRASSTSSGGGTRTRTGR